MSKYNSENEMILDLMPAILGSLIPRKIKCFPEVPRYSGNDHTDIMLIDQTKKAVLALEFKLNGPKGLNQQVEYNRQRFDCFGIINTELREKEKFYWLHSYTGADEQLDMICRRIGHRRWTNINDSNVAGIYYWGYLNDASCFDAGHKNCKRLSMFQLYKKAIYNLQVFYDWKLDFYLVYKSLGFYSISVAKKYFNEVHNHNTITNDKN